MKTIIKTALVAIFTMIFSLGFAQNRYEEIIPCEQIDGNITIKASIKEKEYKFILDTRVLNSVISSDVVNELGVVTQQPAVKSTFITGDTILYTGTMSRMTIGKNIFVENQKINVINNKYLSENKIAGIIGLKPFLGYVLTINMRDKILTTSTPYKPDYLTIKHKLPMISANSVELNVAGKTIPFILDLNAPYFLSLGTESFKQISDSLLMGGEKVVSNKKWYRSENVNNYQQGILPFINVANSTIKSTLVYDNNTKYSFIGSKILDNGVLAIDMVHSSLYFESYETIALPVVKQQVATTQTVVENTPEVHGNVVYLTRDYFLKNVCNYRASEKWKYLGNKPAIIDFWAPWCIPCKKLSPIVDQIAAEYGDKIVVYKLNIDDEPEVSKYFKVGPIPMLMFIPVNGEPIKSVGLQPYEAIKQKVEDILKIK